jgi:acyl-CoA synthetase (AMP-forming)/AMP-acid ligase II
VILSISIKLCQLNIMISLRSLIERQDQNSLALISAHRKLTRRDLLDLSAKCKVSEITPNSTKVFINSFDPVACISNFIAADGFVSSFYLVPQNSAPVLIPQIEGMDISSELISTADGMTRWIIATSGTTGTPKLVAHTLSSLTRTVKKETSAGCQHRWALLYDPCRFAGLQVVLQSLIGGSTLLIPPQNLHDCVNFMIEEGCTAISATPSMWRNFLGIPQTSKLNLAQITLGGEIADEKVLARLKQIFPLARITHIYASTETGVGFSVKDGKAGFPLSFLEQNAGNNIKLKINDAGLLFLKYNGLSQRYIGRSDAISDIDGFINTGDRVEIVGDRVFFLGRANGAINVGGQKVMPEKIENVIRACEGVVNTIVYGKNNPFLGNVVAADVISDGTVSNKEIKDRLTTFCRERLEPYMRPAVIRFVNEIIMTDTGKMERKG